MRVRWVLAAWATVVTIVAGSPTNRLARADEATLATLRVPPGYTVELVAAAPLVQHPVMAGFDDRGRLFVADNAGLNLPADELLEKKPNMIRMLEDTDGDGRFDRSTLFADRMTFPQGAAWYRGALYVASPPSIWRLEDTDDDGVADKRDALVGKFGFTGNAADIHGCFITPTGRIAWCDGRHGHEFHDDAGKTTSKGLAARVFSCRPDGSDVEVFCGGGMDNPVELAFTSAGDKIGSMTFYNPDSARHDALVHFVYGGVYPKKHPCTSEFKRTGPLMPALTRFGVTAPSGLMCYQGTAWGEEFRDNLFSTQFNTHKVMRHVLTPRGATYECADEDFLTSDSADFHPTDVLQDADGSLLVVDTGGWFRIGCPTSQIAKPEVGGAIYRIRRIDAKPPADPRGLAMDWDRISDTEMADQLGDPRPAVVERTIEVLAERGDAAMGALATALFENPDYHARQHAVWALARNGSENARMLLRQVLSDDDAPARQAAAHACGVLRDAESLPILLDLVAQDEPAVRREAATALGRLGDAQAVSVLLAELEKPADRFLEHALVYALIEINDRDATIEGLSHQSPSARRGALVALDQMDDGQLTRDEVAPLLRTSDPALLEAIVGVLAGNPDWADEIVSVAGQWLAQPSPSDDELATARGAIAALGQRPAVQELVAGALSERATAKQVRLMLLEVIATIDNEQPPDVYRKAVLASLASDDRQVVRQAVLTAAALGAAPFSDRLLELGSEAARSAAVRLAAFQAASVSGPDLDDAACAFLIDQLSGAESLADRLAAAEALGQSRLPARQMGRLVELVAQCGPLELVWLLQAFERQPSEPVGLALVSALEKAPALASVPADRLRQVFDAYPAAVQIAARPLLARTSLDDSDRAAKLDALETSLGHGDVALGEDVFFGRRAACSACHRVGPRGERIGPDLSKIGEARKRRDLLEAVLFPSASFARGYESLNVVTTDGKVHSGLLGRETASAMYLRTAQREEIRVARDAIDEITPSKTSIMPEGLEKTISQRELRDLVAYLQSLK